MQVSNVVPYAVAAIQELNRRDEALEIKNRDLEEHLKTLEETVLKLRR